MKGGDTMSRKRRRRKWNKKQYDISKPTAACTCSSEKYAGKHTVNCPAYDGPYTPTKSQNSYKASDWSNSYCTRLHWRTPVLLLEGQVTASAWSDRPKYGVNETESDDVDFGFYLDDLWTGSRITASPGLDLPVTARKPKLIHYPCVDQGAPGDIKSFDSMMEWILNRLAMVYT